MVGGSPADTDALPSVVVIRHAGLASIFNRLHSLGYPTTLPLTIDQMRPLLRSPLRNPGAASMNRHSGVPCLGDDVSKQPGHVAGWFRRFSQQMIPQRLICGHAAKVIASRQHIEAVPGLAET